MGVKQCENGHYYNDEKYKRCPHCDHNSAFQKNHAYTDLEARGMADSVGFADVKPGAAPVPEVYTATVPAEDAELTVGILQNHAISPAVGWTVILTGRRRGTDHTLHAGINSITGFCETADERAVRIVYDARGNQYLLKLETPSAAVTLDGEPVTKTVTVLWSKCRIVCGKTEFLFQPLCDGSFQWTEDDEA